VVGAWLDLGGSRCLDAFEAVVHQRQGVQCVLSAASRTASRQQVLKVVAIEAELAQVCKASDGRGILQLVVLSGWMVDEVE